MLYHAHTLGQLRKAIDSMIKIMGEDAHVGVERNHSPFIDDVLVEYVFINENKEVVGDEANDYHPKENETKSVRLS